ncbi:hypothetical protein L21SP5_02986 [Salinivirga cyanobacteriivorans]|uniref:Uncharacterized protein n=1 Tax=Salinivirga cyanobacteriivorans TaxID=1307839 RepID=A0A0S2I2R8_9BACT|nr:hypothetical protein [Salinivirga cyanobacteriivorans]ALO16606.1 hypothetical protein L21SP5_02986 [Salinivirga cyanobacteriivorans]
MVSEVYFLVGMRENNPYNEIATAEALKHHEGLYEKVLNIAQFESELDMGVNPRNFDQADVSKLSERDAEYISKVCLLAEQRMSNSAWITNTLKAIERKFRSHSPTQKGIRFNDELFKGGRGILEHYLEELEKENY